MTVDPAARADRPVDAIPVDPRRRARHVVAAVVAVSVVAAAVGIGAHALTARPDQAASARRAPAQNPQPAKVNPHLPPDGVALKTPKATWNVELSDPVPTNKEPLAWSEPAAVGDLVAVANSYGHVVAFDARSGEQRWRSDIGVRAGSPAHASPLLVAGNTIVVDDWRRPVGLDPTSGAVRWVLEGADDFPGYRLNGDGGHLIATTRTEMFSLDPNSAADRWRVPVTPTAGDDGPVRPLLTAGVVMAAGSGVIEAFDLEDGRSRWTVKLEKGESIGRAVVAATTLCVIGQHMVSGYDVLTGQRTWRSTVPGLEYGTYGIGGLADGPFVIGRQTGLATVELDSGVTSWQSWSPPSGPGGVRVFGDVVVDRHEYGLLLTDEDGYPLAAWALGAADTASGMTRRDDELVIVNGGSKQPRLGSFPLP